ncbi:hypothetical protein IWQ60_007014 [Tieghemiomyces parasiticus]|uniref:PX domain-containing protein n=1 Tax=Tieghemiomyces parasiticus TaxID=78921 RepID=A0A9W8A4W3_9FUNG|nr:hypothetical protein IWQ60_007014 [Tieghemiomyces parasiticus]
MTLSLAVTKAAPHSETLTYRITIHSGNASKRHEGLASATVFGRTLVSPVFRTHQQVRWLHTQLQAYFQSPDRPGVVLPACPEDPDDERTQEAGYQERKRLQLTRFLQRLCARDVVARSEPLLLFLSENMIPQLAVSHRPGRLLRLKAHRPAADVEFRICLPDEPLEVVDHSRFAQQKTYISDLQRLYRAVHLGLAVVAQGERDLCQSFTTAGDLALQSLHSRYRLGMHKHGEFLTRHKQFDRQVGTLAICFDDLRDLAVAHGHTQVCTLTDVFYEYAAMCNSVKTIMNDRTRRLADYVDALRTCDRALGEWEKIQSLHSRAHESVQTAAKQASQRLAQCKQAYKAGQAQSDAEVDRFAQATRTDLQQRLQRFARQQVGYERRRLEGYQSALHAVRAEQLHVAPQGNYSRTVSLASTYSAGTNGYSDATLSPRYSARNSGSTLIEDLSLSGGYAASKRPPAPSDTVSPLPPSPASPPARYGQRIPIGSDPLSAGV